MGFFCEFGSKGSSLTITASMQHFFPGGFISYNKGKKTPQKQTKNSTKKQNKNQQPNQIKHIYAFERKNTCIILG